MGLASWPWSKLRPHMLGTKLENTACLFPIHSNKEKLSCVQGYWARYSFGCIGSFFFLFQYDTYTSYVLCAAFSGARVRNNKHAFHFPRVTLPLSTYPGRNCTQLCTVLGCSIAAALLFRMNTTVVKRLWHEHTLCVK